VTLYEWDKQHIHHSNIRLEDEESFFALTNHPLHMPRKKAFACSLCCCRTTKAWQSHQNDGNNNDAMNNQSNNLNHTEPVFWWKTGKLSEMAYICNDARNLIV